MRIGLGITIRDRQGGATPTEVLQSYSPVYLRSAPLVADGDDWEDFTPGALSEATDATIVVAFTPAAVDTAYSLVSGDVTDIEMTCSTVGDGAFIARVGGAGNYAQIDQPDDEAHYLTMVFRGGQATNATRLRVWLDGTEVTGGDITHAGTIPAAVPALAAARLGARTSGASPFSGTIHAAVVYASDQSSSLTAIHAAIASFLP